MRELEHTIERGAALARGDTLDVADLAYDAGRPVSQALDTDGNDEERLQPHLDRAAAEHVRGVLRSANGVKNEAAGSGSSARRCTAS